MLLLNDPLICCYWTIPSYGVTERSLHMLLLNDPFICCYWTIPSYVLNWTIPSYVVTERSLHMLLLKDTFIHCHCKIPSCIVTQRSLQCIVTERSLNMLLLKDPLIHFYQKIPSYFVTRRSLNTLSLMWLFNSNVFRLQNDFVINYLVLWFHFIVLYKKIESVSLNLLLRDMFKYYFFHRNNGRNWMASVESVVMLLMEFARTRLGEYMLPVRLVEITHVGKS